MARDQQQQQQAIGELHTMEQSLPSSLGSQERLEHLEGMLETDAREADLEADFCMLEEKDVELLRKDGERSREQLTCTQDALNIPRPFSVCET